MHGQEKRTVDREKNLFSVVCSNRNPGRQNAGWMYNVSDYITRAKKEDTHLKENFWSELGPLKAVALTKIFY